MNPEGVKIVSWNLLHGRGATVRQVESLIGQANPDLLLMQEATADIDDLPHRLGGYYARHPMPGRRHGLAAWSSRPFFDASRQVALQPGLLVKRVCQVIALDGFSIANVHLSHGQIMNRRQLRRIAALLPPRAAIIGDCNMVGPPLLSGFRDVGPRDPTHAMAGLLPLRLDRCLIRRLQSDGAAVLDRLDSDHRPIVVRIIA